MKKVLYLAFCLVLLAGFGCAITDYGTITDNNQVTGKRAAKRGAGVNPVINTKGKAHIQETSQIATIWPDGTDELINFVDQRADGTGTLTTFNNFSTGSEPTFHDDLYCNTDRQGCSVFTAPDNNDGNLFDGTFNSNCSGARSLSILLSTGRYYGECGNNSKVPMVDKANLVNMATFASRFGMEGFLYYADNSNSTITLTDASNGYSELVPFFGSFSLWRNHNTNLTAVDVTDARLKQTANAFQSWLERVQPEATVVTFSYNGIPFSFTIGSNGRIASVVSAHY